MSAGDASWIVGLMRENYEAVGFIPDATVELRYVRQGRYVLQTDERGKRVGYLLHGALEPGRACVVSQHVIQIEKRLRGYGELAFRELVGRCERVGVSSIHLRCADDLPSVSFWQSVGFCVDGVEPGGRKRQRMIVKMNYKLLLPLLVFA